MSYSGGLPSTDLSTVFVDKYVQLRRPLWLHEGAHMMRGPVFGIDLPNLASN
jgi:hypothetical protein